MSTQIPLSHDQEQFDPDADQEQCDLDAPPHAEVSVEEIARLAYQYWRERGAPIGTPNEDWLRAEEEIRLRSQQLS
jgi:hypothetical protein